MDNVIVFYKSKNGTCYHCNDVSNIWDSQPSEFSITGILKNINPKIRFVTVTAIDNNGSFDENLIPKDLIRFGVRFPQIIFIPGKLWDRAMSKLGPNNDVKLIEGVKVINYKIINDKMQYDEKYNIKNPSDYEKWYKSCLDDDNTIKNSNFIYEELTQKNKVSKKEYNISEFTDTCSFKLISRPNK